MKLHPSPGYVVKTRTASGEKCFLNLCYDDSIPAPDTLEVAEIVRRIQTEGDWIVPIIVSPERQDKDKAGNLCRVWDCCMNAQVLNLGVVESAIKMLTIETCLELVEDSANVQLHREYTIPKMKSKGKLEEFDIPNTNFDKPKTVESMLDSAISTPKMPSSKPAQSGVLIEELGETKNDYNLFAYRGPYSGEGQRPDYSLELPGTHQNLSYKGADVICDGITINVGFTITQIEAMFTKDDDTLHIFLWQ